METVKKMEPQELQRSGRVPKEIAILLVGCDALGKEFMEGTKTVVLGRHGANIVSSHIFGFEQELTLVDLESNKEAGIRIVGLIGASDGAYTYEVAFLDSEIDLWGIEFGEVTSAMPRPTSNRRKYPRIPVDFKARIRSCEFEEDIVLCENISRGGLCFKSRRRYYETARIEIASPYSPGSPSILVPAQIVYTVEMAEEKRFRCGVQYLDFPKSSES